jgi:hypothetical protein
MRASGQKVFIPFPKPSQGIEKSRRWISACSRKNFDVSKITRNTYICAVHWPGEKGPTDKHPDPLKATLTPSELLKASCTKRKAPKERSFYISKKMKVESPEQTGETSSLPDSDTELVAQLDQLDDDEREQEYVSTFGTTITNKETQTDYSKYELSVKLKRYCCETKSILQSRLMI